MKLKQDLSIGHNLKRLRTNLNLTQDAIAKKMQLYGCDTTRDIYAQMEIGNYNMRISELLVLKEIFQCDYFDFFTDLPTPEMIMLSHIDTQ